MNARSSPGIVMIAKSIVASSTERIHHGKRSRDPYRSTSRKTKCSRSIVDIVDASDCGFDLKSSQDGKANASLHFSTSEDVIRLSASYPETELEHRQPRLPVLGQRALERQSVARVVRAEDGGAQLEPRHEPPAYADAGAAGSRRRPPPAPTRTDTRTDTRTNMPTNMRIDDRRCS